jgi:hypothetical protein
MGEPFSDDEWRVWALRYLDRWEGDRSAVREYVAAQSRWMVAQLFVANAGALTGVATSEPLRGTIAASGPWFVTGLVLSVLCGLATWFHAGKLYEALSDIADPALIFDRERLAAIREAALSSRRRDYILHGMAVGLGILSLASFVGGAWHVL